MKILIADDHWMIRESLKHAICNLDSSLETVDASTFGEAVNLLSAHPDIDLMLFDLVMPGLSEFEGLSTLRARYPDIPIAVISVHEDRSYVLRAIEEGVIAYIPKSAGGQELVKALTLVLNGGVYFPRDILQGSRLGNTLPTEVLSSVKLPEASPILTTREDEILTLVVSGHSNAAIAKELGLSPNTVRVHLRNASLKLNIKDRADFVAYKAARRSGIKRTQP